MMSTPPPTIELDIPRSARERAFRTLAHEIARDNIVTDALQRLIEQIIREIEESRIAPLRAALKKIAAECSSFPIKDGLAFRCESIARNVLAK
jgi:hypothetical protein